MNLRDRQLDQTRGAILDAFLELAHDGNTVNISIPAVAGAAGVSVRTVYRHFATKDELQTAAAYRMNDQLARTVGLAEVDAATADTYLTELWTGFGPRLAAVIAEHTTPAGRDLRRARLPTNRATIARSLPDDTDPDLVDLLVAATSSSMFLELVDRMEHTPEHAAAMATRLARIILTHATEDT